MTAAVPQCGCGAIAGAANPSQTRRASIVVPCDENRELHVLGTRSIPAQPTSQLRELKRFTVDMAEAFKRTLASDPSDFIAGTSIACWR